MSSQLQRLLLNIVTSNNNNIKNNSVASSLSNNKKRGTKKILTEQQVSVSKEPLSDTQVSSSNNILKETEILLPRKIRKVQQTTAIRQQQHQQQRKNPSVSVIFKLLIEYYKSANRNEDIVRKLYYPIVKNNESLFDYYINNINPVKNIIITDGINDENYYSLKKLFNNNKTIIIVLNFYPITPNHCMQKKIQNLQQAII
ncbi:MAG: LbFV-ORF87-like protein [Cotesia congregata filamentous virus 2]